MKVRGRLVDAAVLSLWMVVIAMGAVAVVGFRLLAVRERARLEEQQRLLGAVVELDTAVLRLARNGAGDGADMGRSLDQADAALATLRRLLKDRPTVDRLAGVEREIAAARLLLKRASELNDPAARKIVTQRQTTAIVSAAIALLDALAQRSPGGVATGSQWRAWQGWAFAVACSVFAALLLTLIWMRRIERRWLLPVANIATIVQRVSGGETFLRIPQQSGPLLRDLADAFNRFIDDFEQLREESRRSIRLQRAVAAAAADAVQTPVLLLSATGQLLFCNTPAKEVVVGDEGRRLLKQLETLPPEGTSEPIVSGRRRFRAESRVVELTGEPDGRLILLHPEGGAG